MFANRREAGLRLAQRLRFEVDPVVLGIARGGVVVADAIAQELSAPLDVLVIRKVGHPLQPELAIGAVSASGETAVTPYAADFGPERLAQLFAAQAERARDLETSLREGGAPLGIRQATVILVDDGIATAATMLCAIAHARSAGASRIVCAAPVAPVESIDQVARRCDDVVVLVASSDRDFAVGRYYADFHEVDNRLVTETLLRHRTL